MALLATLDVAAAADAPPVARAAIFAATREITLQPEWAAKLITTLLGMHSMSANDRFKVLDAFDDAPEQALPSSVNGLCAAPRLPVWRGYLSSEPAARGADGPTVLSVASVAAVDMLARVCGPSFAAALRAPLTAWQALDEVRPANTAPCQSNMCTLCMH